MIHFTKATNGKTTKTFKNPTSTRSRLNLLKFLSVLALVMLLVGGVKGQQVIGSYPGMNGGFEGATIDNNVFSSAQSGKWVKNNATQTIGSEITTVRSGSTSLSATNSSTTGRRIWSPLVTVSSFTSSVTIQYYRRVSNTTNTQESQSAVGDGTTTDAQSGTYSVPSSANTWEKVTYNRSSWTFTNISGAVITRSIGTGGTMFIDDLVMYNGSVDNTAPSSPGAVTVSNPTTSSLDISWVAASGGVDGGGYVVVRYSSNPNANNDPNQNGIYAVGNTTTNGTGSLTGTIRFIGTGTSFTDNVGLSSGTQYWYKVYTVDKAFNYSAESSGNGTTTSSSSSSSNIVLNSGFTHPTNIDYASYQAASTLTTGNSIEVGQFNIQDGGGSSDADALSTTLTACSLSVANSANIRALALFDGSTNVREITTVGSTAAFSSLTLAAADNGSKTFSVRATFKSAVTDNQQISFTVASATASGSGSSFAAANAGAAATTITGDNNRIEVSTTDIIFDQNVSNVAQNAVMGPSPTVRAVDGNANFDLDNTSNVVMTISTGSTTFGSATTTVAMVAGVATFSNLVFTTAASTNQLTATQGAFTDISSNFNVTAAAPEINLKQNATNLASGSGSHAAGNQTSGTSGSAITFTIENLGSANLTYSSITSSNTTDFTLDLTSTSTPIAVSGITTFAVAFNPTTAGAKSTTITINNNDADEGTYTFTVTGTGTVSSTSNIITNSGYSYTSNINYAGFQTASSLTTGNSVGVNGLIIQDGAGAADADNLGTTLTAISFTTGGSTAIRTAALFDGSTNVSEVAVNGATTISFSGLSLSATDASTKNFELRVTYQATVTDNQQITFTVSSANASATNSGFAAANAGAAASTATSDINRLEVTASALAFVAQPANTLVGAGMSNVTVSANDGNGNRDLDFTSSVRITSTGTLTGTPVDVSASSGLATFTSLTHTAAGSSLTLNAERTSGLDWDVTSSAFDITTQAPGLLLTDDDFNYTVSSNIITVGTGWGITSASTAKVTTTSSNNGLTMTNYPSTNTTGISFVAAGSSEDVAKSFTAQTSGSIYASTLINLTSASNGYLTGFTTDNTTSAYEVRVHVRTVSGNLNFGISRGSGTVTWDASNYSLSTTYFLAVKLTMNASLNDDRIDLFVSTSISNSEPSTPNATITSATDVNTIAAVFVRQDASAGAGRMDGIRVATNWGTLVGNPQYNSSTNIAAGNYNNINVFSGTLTATGNVTVIGTTTNDGVIAIGANTLTINRNFTGGGTITGGAASNLTIGGAAGADTNSGIIAGSISLVKSGAGTLTLGDANTYTGATTISGGILQFNRTGGTTIPITNNVTISGGTLKISTNQTLNDVTLNSGTLMVDAGVTLTINGSFTGGGTIQNDGTIVLVGPSNFPGSGTTISAMNNLTINRASNVTLDQSITITGNLTLTNGKLITGACNSTTSNIALTMADNATITGSSSVRFVDGILKKTGNDAFTFPIGSGAKYAPVSLTAPFVITDRFAACYAGSNPNSSYSITSKAGSLNNVSKMEFWHINREVGTSSANVTLSWDTIARSGPVRDMTLLRVCHWNSSSSQWTDLGQTGTTGSNASGTITSGSVTSFSPFTLGSSGSANPLPVTWAYFTAQKTDGGNQLDWGTASEKNTSHFEIEYSVDGGQFIAMNNKINAAGNSAHLLEYRCIHKLSPPLIYYRIKQIDLDGLYDYSKTIILKNKDVTSKNFIKVLPSYVQGQEPLTIQGYESNMPFVFYEIINGQGQRILSDKIPTIDGYFHHSLSLEMYPTGLYYLRVFNSDLDNIYQGKIRK
jgi:autotransporter-associated beta strand protein